MKDKYISIKMITKKKKETICQDSKMKPGDA